MDNQPNTVPDPNTQPAVDPASYSYGEPAAPTPSMDLSGGMSQGPAQPVRVGGGGPSMIMIILVVLLGVGTIGFGIAAMLYYGQAQTAVNSVDQQVATAVAAAVKTQKAADSQAYTKASESPFRAYTAPVADGSFVINFPKSWSGWVDEENSGTDVDLILNPDFVRVTNGTNNLAACVVKLVDDPDNDYMQTFSSLVQQGTLKQTNTTVSGLAAYNLTGNFQDNRTTREVIVPVRNQKLVFVNENAAYATEFDEILAQAQINP